MKTGIELIAQERAEQIEKHGRTIHEDYVYNRPSQLVAAADAVLKGDITLFDPSWTNIEMLHYMVYKPKKDRLIISGALLQAQKDMLLYWADKTQDDIDKISAEIDRLNTEK